MRYTKLPQQQIINTYTPPNVEFYAGILNRAQQNLDNTLLGQLSNTPTITPKSNPGKGGDITLNDIYPAPIFNTIPDFKT